MDPSNFLDIDPLQQDVLQATANEEPQTQNYEGFEMVDTYQINEQAGSAKTQTKDKPQNFDFNQISSNNQQINDMFHESIEPYADPISNIDTAALFNGEQKGTKTTTTTITTKNPTTVQTGNGLSKEEEKEILKLIEAQYPSKSKQEVNFKVPQAVQNVQYNEGFNEDDLVFSEPTMEETYRVNKVSEFPIVNNDIFTNSTQIQTQTAPKKTTPISSASPIIETGLTLGNVNALPNVNYDSQFGEYTTTKTTQNVITQNPPLKTTPKPSASPFIETGLTLGNVNALPNVNYDSQFGEYTTTKTTQNVISQTPPITFGNIEPLPNVNLDTQFGEYTNSTTVENVNTQYVPPAEPVVSKPIPISLVPPAEPVVSKPIPVSLVPNPIPAMTVPSQKPPEKVIVKVPKIQKVVVPKIQKVIVPSKKRIIVKRPNAANVIPPKPVVPVATTTQIPYSVASIPAGQAVVNIPPKPVATTTQIPYSVASIPAGQSVVNIPPKPVVPVATPVQIPYSVASIPAGQTASVVSVPAQIPAPSTIPYSTMSQTIPYSTYSQRVVNQNTVPTQTIPTLPNPAVPIPQNPQILPQPLPVPQQQVSTLPYQTGSFNPMLQKNIVPYGNMSRPNIYNVSSYRANLGKNIPLNRGYGGIANRNVGNMTTPGVYSSRTYNARRL